MYAIFTYQNISHDNNGKLEKNSAPVDLKLKIYSTHLLSSHFKNHTGVYNKAVLIFPGKENYRFCLKTKEVYKQHKNPIVS